MGKGLEVAPTVRKSNARIRISDEETYPSRFKYALQFRADMEPKLLWNGGRIETHIYGGSCCGHCS